MKAVGVHTFFVGFQRGMEKVLGESSVLGSVEGWDRGIRARAACGAGHVPFAEAASLGRVDLVFSNPPCSRYSSMSTGAYSSSDKGQLVNFCELGDAVDVALTLKARALWWETGPLLWGKGMDMVRDVHQKLEGAWGEPATTVVVKTDLRSFGVPQRRPRCHVLHAKGSWEPPDPERPQLLSGSVLEWVRARTPPVLSRFILDPPGPARRECAEMRILGTFESSKPSMVRSTAPYAPAVISARQFAWDVPDRWWSLEEYAALMCYPMDDACAASDDAGPRAAKTLLAKSVSPAAAEGVWRDYFEPTLRTPGSGGVWRVLATYPDAESVLRRPELEEETWKEPAR